MIRGEWGDQPREELKLTKEFTQQISPPSLALGSLLGAHSRSHWALAEGDGLGATGRPPSPLNRVVWSGCLSPGQGLRRMGSHPLAGVGTGLSWAGKTTEGSRGLLTSGVRRCQ